jgi:hypothetical protein
MKDTLMSSLKCPRTGIVEASRPGDEATRRLVAAGLRSASAAFASASRRLTAPAGRVTHPAPHLEFYAEAGAPEGGLVP